MDDESPEIEELSTEEDLLGEADAEAEGEDCAGGSSR